jgi:cytochrome c5
MSDLPSSPDEHEEGHEGPIKTSKQLIWAVFFAFFVPILGIILLANYVSSASKPAAGTQALEAEAVAERIRPVGLVDVRVPGSTPLKTGEDVFKGQCASCHATGAMGAPKFQDAGAWAPRIARGYEALVTSALQGKGAMPAQGGGDFEDIEIGRAVVYMANAGGAKFAEPAASVPAASSP